MPLGNWQCMNGENSESRFDRSTKRDSGGKSSQAWHGVRESMHARRVPPGLVNRCTYLPVGTNKHTYTHPQDELETPQHPVERRGSLVLYGAFTTCHHIFAIPKALKMLAIDERNDVAIHHHYPALGTSSCLSPLLSSIISANGSGEQHSPGDRLRAFTLTHLTFPLTFQLSPDSPRPFPTPRTKGGRFFRQQRMHRRAVNVLRLRSTFGGNSSSARGIRAALTTYTDKLGIAMHRNTGTATSTVRT